MPSLQIPDEDKAALKMIASLDEKSISQIHSSLSSNALGTGSEQIAAALKKAVPSLSESEAQGIVQVLIALESAREVRSFSTDRILQDVCKTLESGGEISRAETGNLKRSVRRLLSAGPLLVSAKVQNLAHEHCNLYVSSRIMVDFRPVFGTGGGKAETVLGGVIVGSLKISYQDSTGTKELYLGVDESDIGQLLATSKRAQTKLKLLKELMLRSSIEDLNP